jgi:hypothetical protein
MAVNTFDSNVKHFREQSDIFEKNTLGLEGVLKGRKISVEEAQSGHEKSYAIYTQALQELSSFKLEVNNQTNYSTQDELQFTVLDIFGIEEKIEKAMTRLSNAMLTFYPTARINYGRACVGSIEPNLDPKTSREFPWKRAIRGDGNCFFTAFTVRYLESIKGKVSPLLYDGINDLDLKQKVMMTVQSLLVDFSRKESIFSDNPRILALVNYFRLHAANELRNNQEEFEATFRDNIEGEFGRSTEEMSYQDLLSEFVLHMGVDAHFASMTALCRKLQFSVNVIAPDIGFSNGLNLVHGLLPQATFFRDGKHYFILYSQEEAKSVKLPEVAPPKKEAIVVKIAPAASLQKQEVKKAVPAFELAPKEEVKAPTETSGFKSITIQYKLEPGHTLFVRGKGKGSGLNWDKGEPLTFCGSDYWVFYPKAAKGEYKFLINDKFWEDGANRLFEKETDRVPKFKKEDLKKLESFKV